MRTEFIISPVDCWWMAFRVTTGRYSGLSYCLDRKRFRIDNTKQPKAWYLAATRFRWASSPLSQRNNFTRPAVKWNRNNNNHKPLNTLNAVNNNNNNKKITKKIHKYIIVYNTTMYILPGAEKIYIIPKKNIK